MMGLREWAWIIFVAARAYRALEPFASWYPRTEDQRPPLRSVRRSRPDRIPTVPILCRHIVRVSGMLHQVIVR